MDDDQATLDVDVAVDVAPNDTGNSGVDSQPEPFLAVNDRTKYATKEDAVKAYNEAGQRINALAPWEKTAKQYGLSDPKHLESIFKETLSSRTELATAKAELAALKKMQETLAQPKPAASNDPKAAEAQQVREYLKSLGYTSKEDVADAMKELKDEIASLKSSGSQAESTRFENQEAEAREWLSGQMSEAKIADDESGTKAQIVGTLVKQFIESSEENLATWNRGGSGAMKLVKAGYEQVLNHLGWKPTEAAPNASAAQAASVGRKLQNGKTLPTQGTARNATAANQPAPRKGINADTHNKAWALLNKA